MATTVAAFNAELSRFASRLVPSQLVDLHKKLTLDVLAGVVRKTPVLTGRARGNWQATVGAPAEAEVDTHDTNGSATISRGAGALTDLRPFSISFVANNVPYIEALENGHSKQAPAGMVELTLEEIRGSFA